MKNLTIISGAFFTSITLLATLFNILHWKGAYFGFLVGMAGLAIVFIPSLMVYLLKRK